MGDEDAGGAAIEGVEDVFGSGGGNANESIHRPGVTACAGGEDAGVERAAVKGCVLGVEADAVERGEGEHLHDDGRRRLDEGADDELAGGEAGFERLAACAFQRRRLLAHAAFQRRSLAMAAPSARVASLAYTISGSTAP